MSLLPCVEIEPENTADACVIWLHGLGADGHDFEPIVPELNLPSSAGIRFIFPHAPSIPVTVNGGYVMPAWYDILDLVIDRKLDEAQLLESVASIRGFIDREIERGIDSRRIILAGFSQGGAVCYQLALTYPRPLGGLLVMSTYFATKNTIVPSPENQSIPIQIMHGTFDPVVDEALGQQAHQNLVDMDYPVNYQTYPIEHSVCLEEIQLISQWLQQRLLA